MPPALQESADVSVRGGILINVGLMMADVVHSRQ
jgi:hypothetical protein